MKLLVIDNYDSFTYNLVQYVRKHLCGVMEVKRNDAIAVEACKNYDKILLSPGPGIPSEAGIMKSIIEQYGSSKSILGVCLGMQGIAEVYGSSLLNLEKVHHGVSTTLSVTSNDPLFNKIPDQTEVGRYHSWAVDEKSLGKDLEVIAKSHDDCVMAIRHKTFDVRGVQFHPESVLTPCGEQIIQNWLSI